MGSDKTPDLKASFLEMYWDMLCSSLLLLTEAKGSEKRIDDTIIIIEIR